MEKRILPLIVIAQFACTSLWFAGNAVIADLQDVFKIENYAIGHVTSAVQFGFITGTFVFALLTLSDRFSPTKIFFICSVLAAGANSAILFPNGNAFTLLFLRALTGFLLAGIYPVGMKIASDYFEKGLGKALGFLLGALVLGTAFPHLIKTITESLLWKYVIISTSCCALAGGLLILFFVPDGPFRKKSNKIKLNTLLQVFKETKMRAAAYGYFGHMWELYTFWAFVPVILSFYQSLHPLVKMNIPFFSFIIIASGGITCIAGGFLSEKIGNAKVAFIALLCSGFCCLISPLIFELSFIPFFIVLLFWGLTVIPDSPQFSTMVAQFSAENSRGTALTIVNCIGFSITIVSIQAINILSTSINNKYLFLFLALGPALGLISMLKLFKKSFSNVK